MKRHLKKNTTWNFRAGWLAMLAIWSAAGAVIAPHSARAADETNFKFPVLLCVYQYTVVDEQGSLLQLMGRETEEYAYRVRDIQEFNTQSDDGQSRMMRIMTGRTTGTMQIENTPYRVRFEAKIRQGVGDGRANDLQIRSYLEKREGESDNYILVGQRTSAGTGITDKDGSVWKVVHSRAFNSESSSVKNDQGKIDSQRVIVALRDGKVVKGSIINAGPACGLMDIDTAKQVTSHRSELADIFERWDHAKMLASNSRAAQSSSSSVATLKTAEKTEKVETAQVEQAPKREEAPAADAHAADVVASQDPQTQQAQGAQQQLQPQQPQQNVVMDGLPAGGAGLPVDPSANPADAERIAQEQAMVQAQAQAQSQAQALAQAEAQAKLHTGALSPEQMDAQRIMLEQQQLQLVQQQQQLAVQQAELAQRMQQQELERQQSQQSGGEPQQPSTDSGGQQGPTPTAQALPQGVDPNLGIPIATLNSGASGNPGSGGNVF